MSNTLSDIGTNEHVYSHGGNIKTVKNKIRIKEKKKKEEKIQIKMK